MKSSFKIALAVAMVASASGIALAKEVGSGQLLPMGSDGTITDGAIQWELGPSNFDGTPEADLRGLTAGDEVFESGWWFRVAGDAAETPMPLPDSSNFAGAQADLDWADVGARGLFSASAVHTVIEGGGAIGRVDQTLEITNISGAELQISLFHFIDVDANSSFGSDSAVAGADPGIIDTTDGAATVQLGGIGADAFQVTAFSSSAGVRGLLNDAAPTTLDNTGLPFGPGDITSAFQWNLTIPADGTATVEMRTAGGGTVPVELTGFSIE